MMVVDTKNHPVRIASDFIICLGDIISVRNGTVTYHGNGGVMEHKSDYNNDTIMHNWTEAIKVRSVVYK